MTNEQKPRLYLGKWGAENDGLPFCYSLDYQLKGEGERTFPGYVSYETNFEGDDYPEISPFYAFEDYEACYKAATHAAKALAEHNPKHDIRVRIVAYQLHKCFLEGSVTVKANGRIYRGPAE